MIHLLAERADNFLSSYENDSSLHTLQLILGAQWRELLALTIVVVGSYPNWLGANRRLRITYCKIDGRTASSRW